MGLDIYAGTMTRYYAHNWKTAVQQWAEEHGYTFQRITPSGDEIPEDEKMSPAEIQADIENWQQQVLSAITQPGQKPYTPWTENNEKPYYTDKPDWDAFGAMLLVAVSRCILLAAAAGQLYVPGADANWRSDDDRYHSRTPQGAGAA